MPGGKSNSTRSATAGVRAGPTGSTNHNVLSRNYDNKIDSLKVEFTRKRQSQKREFDNITEKVVRLENEVGGLKEHVGELKGEINCLRAENSKLQSNHRNVDDNSGDVSENKSEIRQLQNTLENVVKTYIRDHVYGMIKFVETDHLNEIYSVMIQRPEFGIPKGIDKTEHKKIVVFLIKKAFRGLRHNSQTLIRRYYIGKLNYVFLYMCTVIVTPITNFFPVCTQMT